MNLYAEETSSLPRVHPLLIPYVIKSVFQYCPFEDLKTSRLVCHQWHAESTKELVSRSCLHLRNYDDVEKFMDVFGEMVSAEANADLEDSREPKATSFYSALCSHIRLSGLEFQKLPMPLRPFLQKFCENIKTIEIDHGAANHCASGMIAFLREFKVMNLTKLETLLISGSYISSEEREPLCPSENLLPSVKTFEVRLSRLSHRFGSPEQGIKFFREVFRALPNLENLTSVNYSLLFLYTTTTPLLEDMVLPGQKLTSLSLNLHIWDGTGIRHFIRQGYSLKTMKLRVEASMSLNLLHLLISSQNHSLEHLELTFASSADESLMIGYNYAHNSMSFPSAPHLKQVKLLRLVGFSGNLYFLKDMPSLEKVIVERMQLEVAFPSGTDDESLIPLRVKRMISFWDQKDDYCEL